MVSRSALPLDDWTAACNSFTECSSRMFLQAVACDQFPPGSMSKTPVLELEAYELQLIVIDVLGCFVCLKTLNSCVRKAYSRLQQHALYRCQRWSFSNT